MKLLKENSYEIVRLAINQVGITIFALVLYTGLNFGMAGNTSHTIQALLSVFATVFYLVLLYFAGWEYGSKDKLKIDSGKMSVIRGKGAIMSLVANSINILLIILAVSFALIYLASGAEWFYTFATLIAMIIKFTSAMFLGIVNGIFSGLDPVSRLIFESLMFLVMPVLAIGATQLGYSFGSRDFRILSIFKSSKNSSSKKD